MNEETKAADMAQRVADLEAERDAAQQARRNAQALAERYQAERNQAGVQARREVGEQVRKLTAERDELRELLAELDRQEPVAHLCRYRSGEEFASLARRPLIDKDVESSLPLYARPAPAIPEGWKLVPVEPTTCMLDAARSQSSFPLGVYRAMIAAAPEHKA